MLKGRIGTRIARCPAFSRPFPASLRAGGGSFVYRRNRVVVREIEFAMISEPLQIAFSLASLVTITMLIAKALRP
jgi:hypothetical protein